MKKKNGLWKSIVGIRELASSELFRTYYLKVKFIMGGQEVNFNNNYSNHCIQIQITRGLFKLISRENGNYNKI